MSEMSWRDKSFIVTLYRTRAYRKKLARDGVKPDRIPSSNDHWFLGCVGVLLGLFFYFIGASCFILLFANDGPRTGYAHFWLIPGLVAFPIGTFFWKLADRSGGEIPPRHDGGDRQGFPDYG